MKKYVSLSLSLICIYMLIGCNGDTSAKKIEQISLQKLPGDYTVEQAKEDGCVIYEDDDITYGQEIWDSFVEATSAKNEAAVRLGFYYTLDDPSRYDPDYYKLIKDSYPLLFIQDLEYDGTTYTIREFEDGNEITRTYQYLMKYEGDAESPHASYDSYVRYVLTNDNTLTWKDIIAGMISSQWGAYVDHYVVYVDLM